VEFVGYPLHMDGGSGTVWVDLPDDILAKVEVRTDLPNGGHRVMTRQLSSLNLTPAISPGDLAIPKGFAISPGMPAASAACSAH